MITVLRYVRLRRVALAGAAAAAAELSAAALAAVSAFLIARAAQQPSIAAITVAVAAVRGLALARGSFRYADRLVGHDAALRAVAGLRVAIYRALVRRPDPVRDGDALTRLVSDSDSVQDLILRVILPATTAIITSAAAVTASALLLPTAGVRLAAGLIVAGVLIPAGVAAASRRTGERVSAARSRLAVSSLDLVDGARDLAVFGATERARDRAHRQALALARADRLAAAVAGAATATAVIVQGLTTILVALSAIRAGADSVVVAVVALTALAAFEAVLPLTEAAQQAIALRPALRRVTALLRTPPDAAPASTTSPTGDIDLRSVTVHYDRPALVDISLQIPAGRAVAVVGANGAGKSTLLNVLAGVQPLRHGTATLPEARALTQDAHVFQTSIRANLILARPDATDAQLEEAARQAGLLDWIGSLPHGWDTTVGGPDQRLSGGQRQRLLLARALLADPEALLLDEPTESLDPDLADRVLLGVLAARHGRTTLVVTHRLAPLESFDEILVMDAGRLVDRGSHRHLVGRAGVYRDLWLAQRMVSSSSPV